VNKIKVKKSKLHGRGVFATKDIQKGEIIEICHALVLSKSDTKKIDDTDLYNYYFSWKGGQSALALGHGSLYNHSYTPNAKYIKHASSKIISFVALQTIKSTQEITINYNGNPLSKEKVWFEK